MRCGGRTCPYGPDGGARVSRLRILAPSRLQIPRNLRRESCPSSGPVLELPGSVHQGGAARIGYLGWNFRRIAGSAHVTCMNASVVSRPLDEHLVHLAQCRAVALEMMPYLSSILLRLDVWNAPGLGTYAVDRRWRLYIDFDHCIVNESVQLGAESMLHECGHLLGEHARISDELGIDNERRRRLLNRGADCAINDDLAAAGCDELAKIGVLPAKIGAEDFKTPQHYYFILRKKQAKAPKVSPAAGQRCPAERSGRAARPAERRGRAEASEWLSAESAAIPWVRSGSGGENAPYEFVDGDDAGDPVSTIEAEAILVQAAQDIIKSRGTARAAWWRRPRRSSSRPRRLGNGCWPRTSDRLLPGPRGT